MQTSTNPPTAMAARPIQVIDVPPGPDVVQRLLPAVTAALQGGPALVPVPARPPAVREAAIAAFRPDMPLADDTAVVISTSGSTDRPKGALLSSHAIRASADATHQRLGGPGRWLLALPATHIAGLMVVARSVIAGTEPVAVDLTKGFDPDVFSAASDRLFAVTGRHYTAMVPRQLADVLRAAGRPLAMLARYDAVLVGGAATDAALLHSARRAGVTVVVSYGMTETCGGCVYDGVPLTGAKIAVTNDHRLQVAGPMLAHGYRLRPDLADAFAGGWFTTSDVGHIECDGTLVINGRIDDVAISGGVKVPLVDVDVAVSSHPMVAEALSVGVADDRWGQRIVVAVVPTEPARPPLLQSIRAHVREKYPVAYAPQELHVLSELPLLPSGKPDRHGLADQLDRTALGPAD